MWNVRRNDQHFSRAHDIFLIVYDEFQCAFKDVSDLLIFMAVQWHNAAGPQKYSREHTPFASNKLPIEQGVKAFDRHILKSDVLESRRFLHLCCAHSSAPVRAAKYSSPAKANEALWF